MRSNGSLNVFESVGPTLESTAAKIGADFLAFLDEWHQHEVFDDELDAQIHRWYADVNRERPPRGAVYFSPSATGASDRELYVKMIGHKRDERKQPPHQGRWTRIGTAIGDVIQRDILFAEKHFEAKTGNPPPFKFVRDAQGRPLFEDFAQKYMAFSFDGVDMAVYGTCDGIMKYYDYESGEVYRVGLEVKSKQTTAAVTSSYSMRNGPDPKHVAQTNVYSIMYGSEVDPIDFYIVLYVNAAKKSWNMSAEDYEKTPDIAVFCYPIEEAAQVGVLQKFANVIRAAAAKEPPPLDLFAWTFNNYKRACALDLSVSEVAGLAAKVDAIKESSLKPHIIADVVRAFDHIIEIREAEGFPNG